MTIDDEYRIRERMNGDFVVEKWHRVIETEYGLFKETTRSKMLWVTVNEFGNPARIFEGTATYPTLGKARAAVQRFLRGNVIHAIGPALRQKH